MNPHGGPQGHFLAEPIMRVGPAGMTQNAVLRTVKGRFPHYLAVWSGFSQVKRIGEKSTLGPKPPKSGGGL